MVRHASADDEVRKFLNYADLPVRIVTGRSKQMRDIAVKVLCEYEYGYNYESSYNYGALIITEKKTKR